MHLFHVFAVFFVLLMVGSELSVSAFVDPSAWRLDPGPQAVMLSHFAAVLGKVMPFWYGAGLLVIGVETWLFRHSLDFALLLTATGL